MVLENELSSLKVATRRSLSSLRSRAAGYSPLSKTALRSLLAGAVAEQQDIRPSE